MMKYGKRRSSKKRSRRGKSRRRSSTQPLPGRPGIVGYRL